MLRVHCLLGARDHHSHNARAHHPRGAFVCAIDDDAGKTCIARLLIAELLTGSVELSDGEAVTCQSGALRSC